MKTNGTRTNSTIKKNDNEKKSPAILKALVKDIESLSMQSSHSATH